MPRKPSKPSKTDGSPLEAIPAPEKPVRVIPRPVGKPILNDELDKVVQELKQLWGVSEISPEDWQKSRAIVYSYGTMYHPEKHRDEKP